MTKRGIKEGEEAIEKRADEELVEDTESSMEDEQYNQEISRQPATEELTKDEDLSWYIEGEPEPSQKQKEE